MTTTSKPPTPKPDHEPDAGPDEGRVDRATFSVIIPTYRRPDLVIEAVASVRSQTRADWECLVVDDGGGGPLDDLMTDPRIRVIRRPSSGGPAAARNTGLAEARGSIVTFLDDDDRYRPRRLELAAAALADPAVDVALCWTAWFDPSAADRRSQDRPAANTDAGSSGRRLVGDIADVVLDATTPHLGATAVRASAVLRFDESYPAAEDVEWWLRTAATSRVATVEAVGCELRRHAGPRSNGTDVTGRIAASEHLIHEHQAYFAVHPRAEAFRLARMGIMALSSNDRRAARTLLGRSLRRRPSALAARGFIRTWAT